MARKAKPKPIEPEDIHQEDSEVDDSEIQGNISKAEAIRRALAEGADSPEDGTEFIRKRFGIEVSKQRFSSSKSQFKKQAEATIVTIPRRRGRPRLADVASTTLKAKAAPGREGELIAVLEALKPLVASLGADKVKRLVDLLG